MLEGSSNFRLQHNRWKILMLRQSVLFIGGLIGVLGCSSGPPAPTVSQMCESVRTPSYNQSITIAGNSYSSIQQLGSSAPQFLNAALARPTSGIVTIEYERPVVQPVFVPGVGVMPVQTEVTVKRQVNIESAFGLAFSTDPSEADREAVKLCRNESKRVAAGTYPDADVPSISCAVTQKQLCRY
jgi:hypothetical protein